MIKKFIQNKKAAFFSSLILTFALALNTVLIYRNLHSPSVYTLSVMNKENCIIIDAGHGGLTNTTN